MSLQKKIFSVNSRDRESGTPQQFRYRFRIPSGFEEFRSKHVSVLNLNIPKSFYLIDTSNQTIHVVDNTTGAPGYDFNIPIGYYSANELASILQTDLTANVNVDNYTVQYVARTGLFEFTNTTGPVAFAFNDLAVSLQKILGLDEDNASSGLVLESVRVATMQRTNRIIVKSNMVLNADDTYLCEAYPASVGSGSVYQYQAQDPKLETVMARDFRSDIFEFTLEDDQGNLIPMNGIDWNMTLVLYGEK